MFTADWFFDLDARLRETGLDSDAQSFDEIKENLSHRRILDADAFAGNCIYVILAGGFSQKTAKKIHAQIMDFLRVRGADFDGLFALFHNKNKINAVCKVNFLSRLPHIGKITANHLARNLGEDVVKYDIWIQRLGVLYARNPGLGTKIDNKKLCAEIKCACDAMFDDLCNQTGLPRGYIDVVLWKSSQVGLIKELKNGC